MDNRKQKKQEETGRKIKTSTVILIAMAGILFALAGIFLLAFGSSNIFARRMATGIAKIIPLPAAIINYTAVIATVDIGKNLQSVKRFYENQDFSSSGLRVDFSTDAGKKRLKMKEKEVFNKMLEDNVIILLAKKNGIEIEQADVNFNVQKKLDEYGVNKDSVEKDLQRLYGWSLDDFKRKVVMQNLYEEALQGKIASLIVASEEQNDKIMAAKKELDAGKDFAQVAGSYSEGFSAQQGGEVGWITKDQLVPGLQEALFPQKGNPRVDQILESSLGYHIIQIEETKNAVGVNADQMVRIRQIFVRKPSFASWLEDQMKGMTIFIGLPGYRWDKQSGAIEFTDPDMIEFEKKNAGNSDGDASLMH